MGTSKILIDGVGIDLTQDTVAANKMLSGIKAHNSSGDIVTGNIQTWTGTQASGAKSITENGTFDVSEFASAAVNVPLGSMNSKVIFVELLEKAPTRHTIVSADPDVLAHYQDDTFICGFMKVEGLSDTGAKCGICGNNLLITSSYYGICFYSDSAFRYDGNVTAENYVKVCVNSSGDIHFFSSNSTTRPFNVGKYMIFIAW